MENEIIKIIQGSPITLDTGKLMFQRLYEKYKEKFPTYSESDIIQYTLQSLANKVKRAKFSGKAVEFTGIFFGQTTFFDLSMSKRYRELREKAERAWKENPSRAIAEGLCDAQGNPLDTMQYFPSGNRNMNYNKPIPQPGQRFASKIYGVCTKSGTEEIKEFVMFLSKKECVPLFKPVRFLAIVKDESQFYKLNESSVTTFVIDESLKIPDITIIIEKLLKSKFITLSDLVNWHKQNENNAGAYFIAKTFLWQVDPTPNALNKKAFYVDDMTTASELVKCWAPDFIDIDFGPGSEILIFGNTYLSDKGSKTDEDISSNIIVNVLGLYPINPVKPNINTSEQKIAETLNKSLSETIATDIVDEIEEVMA